MKGRREAQQNGSGGSYYGQNVNRYDVPFLRVNSRPIYSGRHCLVGKGEERELKGKRGDE